MTAPSRPNFCQCLPLRSRRGGAIARWDDTTWNGKRWVGEPRELELTYYVGDLPRAWWDSIDWAWRQWEAVAALRLTRVDDKRAADIRYTHGPIDGRSGTLAWAYLPVGPDRPLDSKIDSAESWRLDPEAPPRDGVHLGAVMCHENGHLLGLEHDTTAERALLDPSYGPDVLTPQRWDIEQAQLRYGPPIDAAPDPVPGPEPPAGERARVEVTVGAARYVGTLPRAA